MDISGGTTFCVNNNQSDINSGFDDVGIISTPRSGSLTEVDLGHKLKFSLHIKNVLTISHGS